LARVRSLIWLRLSGKVGHETILSRFCYHCP
jgi:hypothetical protein